MNAVAAGRVAAERERSSTGFVQRRAHQPVAAVTAASSSLVRLIVGTVPASPSNLRRHRPAA